MENHFNIVANTLEPVAIERLERVFRATPGFTAADAHIVSRDRAGILARSLSAEQAAVMQANLRAEGVATEIVERTELPVLPESTMIRKLEFTPEALESEDQIGRPIRVEWSEVFCLGAGSLREVIREKTEEPVDSRAIEWRRYDNNQPLRAVYNSLLGLEPTPLWGSTVEKTKTVDEWFLRLELMLVGGIRRYIIPAEKFNFTCLGEARTKDLAGNFCLLVRELAERMPQARLTRGAVSILSEPCEFAYYKHKQAFYDELIWMLWQAGRGAS